MAKRTFGTFSGTTESPRPTEEEVRMPHRHTISEPNKMTPFMGIVYFFGIVLCVIGVILLIRNISPDNKTTKLTANVAVEFKCDKNLVLNYFSADVPLKVYAGDELICEKWEPGQNLDFPPSAANRYITIIPYADGKLTHLTKKR
ncbi:MAG: hypothetical protein R3B64_02725 [Candidatus Paceibacterota bacterium]